MTELDVLSIARNKYREATQWYIDRNVEAAERFIAEVEAAFSLIQRYPEQHLRWDEWYHYYLLKKFPFYVPYRIQQNSVVVVAVFHAARDAAIWTGR